MGYKVNFTDGTFFYIPSSADVPLDHEVYGFSDTVLAIANGHDPIKTAWVGEKTDLDGNKWDMTEGGTLTFKRTGQGDTVINLTNKAAIACFYLPQEYVDSYFISNYAVQYRSLYIDSSDDTDMNFAQAVGEYPDDRKINLTSSMATIYYSGDHQGITGIGGARMMFSWFSESLESTDPEPVPYDPAGTSTTGGGSGKFDGTSDAIDFPSLPTLSAADTGFITLFNPTATQLKNLANYMWSNPLFDLDAWKKIFADPMDAILGLSIVPVDVPSGGASAVTVGNISTGVSMTKATSQFVEVDCGTLNVNEYWGAYLDYSPYTKCFIHLPYCGIHPLDVDDIMKKPVHVKYHVDILSGACCVYVKCGNSVLYTFVGQCSASIPITGDNWTNVINGVMQIAASVGTMVATGGLSAPVTGANAAAAVGQAVAADANIASTIMSMKPSIEHSGSVGGMGGMLAIQTPYLILTRPRQALPVSQNKYTGYPSFITSVLSTLKGYTEIEHIHLEGIPATSDELDEIVTLLKGGVIL